MQGISVLTVRNKICLVPMFQFEFQHWNGKNTLAMSWYNLQSILVTKFCISHKSLANKLEIFIVNNYTRVVHTMLVVIHTITWWNAIV